MIRGVIHVSDMKSAFKIRGKHGFQRWIFLKSVLAFAVEVTTCANIDLRRSAIIAITIGTTLPWSKW